MQTSIINTVSKLPKIYLPSNHLKGFKVLKSFAEGLGYPLEKIKIYNDKDHNKIRRLINEINNNDLVAVFGIKHGQQDIMKKFVDVFYIDNGYFLRSDPLNACNGYYRVCLNNPYGSLEDKERNKPWDRFEQMGLKLKPKQQKRKDFVYLAAPSELMCKQFKYYKNCKNITYEKPEDWINRTVKKLRSYTDREIVVGSKHKNKTNIKKDIPWCVVTCMSNIQIDCLIEGIPVITTNFSNLGDFKYIEDHGGMLDFEAERQILADLSYKQWTLKQFSSGQAWRELNGTN